MEREDEVESYDETPHHSYFHRGSLSQGRRPQQTVEHAPQTYQAFLTDH
jgi:hypothetical protein